MQNKTTDEIFTSQGFSGTIRFRFWKKVNKSGTVPNHFQTCGQCWEWTAATSRDGYGVIGVGRIGSGVAYAHRVSWIINTGEIPDGKCVLHRCDNRKCVNPSHLFLGDKKDNAQDMLKKGRNKYKTRCGIGHHKAKLSSEKAEQIRSLYASGSFSWVDLAGRFGVSDTAIGAVISGKNWKPI